MSDLPLKPPSDAAQANEKLPTVLASRIAAVLGAVSFALTVTAITMIKSSGVANAATMPMLIFAVFGGMGAVVLGMLGVAQARKLLVGGILLGLIGVLTGAATALVSPLVIFSVKHFQSMQIAQPCIESTKQWFMFVGSGNIVSAKALSGGKMDEGKLTDEFERIQSWGTIKSVDANYGGDARDMASIEIQAKIEFDKVTKILITKWDATGRSPVLNSYEFRDDPKAPPATTQSN